MPDPAATWDEARSAHKTVTRTVYVPMRSDLLDEIDRLEQQILVEAQADALQNRDPVAPGLARRVQDLERQVAESEVAFTFQGIARRAKDAIEAAHPPTDEQQAKAEADGQQQLRYNPDTYPPALLAASCVSPEGFDEAAAVEVWEEWSEGQAMLLWNACLVANLGTRDAGPKSQIASAILHASEPNSTTAPR